jgi:hypothetical protein
MPVQSKFARLAAKTALCFALLLAINAGASAGDVRDHRSGSGGSSGGSSSTVRDHRSGSGGSSGGGVQVTTTSHSVSGSGSTVRDHRTKPVVRDHRKSPTTGFCFGGLFSTATCY